MVLKYICLKNPVPKNAILWKIFMIIKIISFFSNVQNDRRQLFRSIIKKFSRKFNKKVLIKFIQGHSKSKLQSWHNGNLKTYGLHRDQPSPCAISDPANGGVKIFMVAPTILNNLNVIFWDFSRFLENFLIETTINLRFCLLFSFENAGIRNCLPLYIK